MPRYPAPKAQEATPSTVDANDISSSQIDPVLAQTVLSKVAGGQSLSPTEKTAASKLPPSVLARAALSGSAPLPDNYTPPVVGPKIQQAKMTPAALYGMGNSRSGAVPKTDVGGADPTGSDTMGGQPKPMGNSAENEGLMPNGHYVGKAAYSGATMRDPVAPAAAAAPPTTPKAVAPAAAAAPPTTPKAVVPAQNSPTPATSLPQDTPNVKLAKAVVADPKTPPSLKSLNGKDIATLIGNILDVVGVGLSARGGVNRQTMLQHQMELQRQVSANTMQKQSEAGIGVAKMAAESPIQIEQARQIAHNSGDIETENALRQKQGMAKIDLSNAQQLAKYTADLDVSAKEKLYAWMRTNGIQVPGSTVPNSLYTNPYQLGVSSAGGVSPNNP